MKTKTLAQVDGFIGIIAGAVLAFLPFLLFFLQLFQKMKMLRGLYWESFSLFSLW